VNLGLALDPRRFDLRFACMRRWGHFLSEVEDRGIPLHEYPVPRFASLQCLLQQIRLARYITRHDVEIVHSYNFYGNVFAIPAARLAGASVVIASIRDQGVYLTPKQKALQRLVCRLADCVLVNASAVRDWLIGQGYDAGKIAVIRNGIDLSRFQTTSCRADVMREVGIPEQAPVVATVSRLIPAKGIEHLLEAAALVAPRHPNLHVLIVGEALVTRNDGVVAPNDTYLESLVERARRLQIADRVVFTGYRPDVPALLPHVSVSVQPSLSEGLSNVILESMAAGVPVVATRVGGTAEVVVDGQTGLLVPPADPPSMARALTRLLDDPALRQRMGAAGRKVVEHRFSVERMVESTERLYMDLLSRGRSRRLARRPVGALAGGPPCAPSCPPGGVAPSGD
jgi:glycosyltransferase involved in cell wall biosynthesis